MTVFIVYSRHKHDDNVRHVEQVASTEATGCSLAIGVIQEEHLISGDAHEINEVGHNHWSDGFIETWVQEYDVV